MKTLITMILLMLSTPTFAGDTLQFTAKLDLTAPVIKHTPLSQPLVTGETATISATITDETGVAEVTLFFRPIGSNEYLQVAMPVLNNHIYSVDIPNEYVQGPGMEYYIKAMDNAGNTVLKGLNFSPLTVAVKSKQNTFSLPPLTEKETALMTELEQAETEIDTSTTSTAQSNNKNWGWWLLGAFAAGTAIAISRNGSSNDDSGEPTGSITIVAPAP